MKIYIASSWKNPHYQMVCDALRSIEQEIMDWRKNGFGWQEVSDAPKSSWTGKYYRDYVLRQPRAFQGFKNDKRLMMEADCCVLLLPCGRSAHLEAGWFAGALKPLFIYIPEFDEPELMYKFANRICLSMRELEQAIISLDQKRLVRKIVLSNQ